MTERIGCGKMPEQLPFDGFDTLALERERIRVERNGPGTHCNACGQFVKVYHRQIHSSIAVALIVLFKMNRTAEWVHTTNISKVNDVCINGRCEIPKALYWGLIEECPVDVKELENGSNRVGLYRITEKGKDFVLNKSTVPKYAYIFNDTILGFSEETVGIKDCLKNKFNYHELMES